MFADLGDCFFPAVGVDAEEFVEIFARDVDTGGVEGVVGGEITDCGLFGLGVAGDALEHPLEYS